MDVKEINNQLGLLAETSYWEALSEYIDNIIRESLNSLSSLDASNKPTEISRIQGSIGALNLLKVKVKEEADKLTKPKEAN